MRVSPLLVAAMLLAASPARTAPRAAVEPPGFDFGDVLQHSTLHKEFRLSNFGDATLVVERITTSCGCTVVEPGESSLPPGASTRLRVALRTGADRGRVVRTVLIETNDPELGRIAVELRANVQEK